MTNGVRQGAVLSAIVYCFYCEDLFALLKKRRAGCWIMNSYHGILGYSDDNWLLAPSLSALQDMLATCEEYASTHNLKFSTDTNPVKCKTKLMAFMKKPRELPSLELCGNPLPWVDRVKHLGNTISNVINGNQLDTKIKACKYIDKNNSLCQEFYFAHPRTKLEINNIYNSHFTGSQLWDLGSKEVEKLESTYNRSVKIMVDLPWATHRYLIAPLTERPHLSTLLVKRYTSFISKIEKSPKKPLQTLFQLAKRDVRTVTGSNMRRIMMISGRQTIDDIQDAEVQYHPVPDSEAWRVDFVKELVELQHGNLEVVGMLKTELDQIMSYLCTE